MARQSYSNLSPCGFADVELVHACSMCTLKALKVPTKIHSLCYKSVFEGITSRNCMAKSIWRKAMKSNHFWKATVWEKNSHKKSKFAINPIRFFSSKKTTVFLEFCHIFHCNCDCAPKAQATALQQHKQLDDATLQRSTNDQGAALMRLFHSFLFFCRTKLGTLNFNAVVWSLWAF